jgi:hypothetical protein
MRPSLCAIQHERDTNRSPTLGIFKPGQITRLVIEDAEQPSWTPEHNLTCFDWEMGQAYRRWRRQYGDNWEQPFRSRFESEMISKNDTHLFVGNLHQFPTSWIVVGLFYPPKLGMADLFD